MIRTLQSLFHRSRLWPFFLLAILMFAVYAPMLSNSFVWDDYAVIVYNDFVKSWNNFHLIFSKDYIMPASDINYLGKRFVGSGEVSYRPIVTMSYFLDYSFWKLNAFGYHLTNLLLHMANVALFYILSQLIFKNKTMSLAAALIFALHPIQTEAVDNISFREDLLAFLFYTVSFILYIKLKSNSGRGKAFLNLASVILFLAALFSKEMAITLPAVLMLYDYYFDRVKSARNLPGVFVQRYGGYILAALFYFWIWHFVFPSRNELITFQGQTWFTNFFTMAKVFAGYIGWLLYPVNIHATVPDASIAEYSLLSAKVILSIAVVTASLLYAFKTRHTSKVGSFAILWFFISLLPVSNFIPIQNIMACRYLYIPIAGFCLFLAFLLERISGLKMAGTSPGFMKKMTGVFFLGLLLVYSCLTIARGFTWKNNDVFFMDLKKYYPKIAWIHSGLGGYYLEKNLLEQAIREYKRAIAIDPHDLRSRFLLGNIYLRQGALDEAIQEYSSILHADTNNKEVQLNLCLAWMLQGKHSDSIACFENLIKAHPAFVPAYYHLGIAYMLKGDTSDARKMWEKTLILDPADKNVKERLKQLR